MKANQLQGKDDDIAIKRLYILKFETPPPPTKRKKRKEQGGKDVNKLNTMRQQIQRRN